MINIFKNMISILDVFKIYKTQYGNLYKNNETMKNSRLYGRRSIFENSDNRLHNITTNDEKYKPPIQNNQLVMRGISDKTNDNVQNNIQHPTEPTNIYNEIIANTQPGISHNSRCDENIASENDSRIYNPTSINYKTSEFISNINNIYSDSSSFNNMYNTSYNLLSYNKNFKNRVSNFNQTLLNPLKNISGESNTYSNIAYKNNINSVINTTDTANHIKYINKSSYEKNYSNDIKNYSDYANNYHYNSQDNNTDVNIYAIIEMLKQELFREYNSSAKGVY